MTMSQPTWWGYFNSRPCERGDGWRRYKRLCFAAFQFTPLREGRPEPGDLLPGQQPDFNSRPCERGDGVTWHSWTTRGSISIHAPARGATLTICFYVGGNAFQFTPLREGRLSSLFCCCGGYSISIHAPARGATRHGFFTGCTSPYFNSRPCERGDNDLTASLDLHIQFQFTPLREGRPPECPHCACLHAISIHAPARGATALFCAWRSCRKNFNSRPCERGDGKIKQNMLCFFCNYREKLPTFRQHQLS